MANPPPLLLIVDNGPRSGETLECDPGAQIRIGRVVRGNTFPIKDPGISQKHLVLKFLPNTSRWAVTDLETSNGTLLNGASIPPSAPSPLSDGDTIKIGEATSITVRIHATTDEDGPRLRRRRGRAAAVAAPPAKKEADLDVVGEEADEVLVKNLAKGRGRKRRAAGSAVVAEEAAEATKPPKVPKKGMIQEQIVDEANKETKLPKEKDEILEPVAEESYDAVQNIRSGRGCRRQQGRGRGRAPVTRTARARASVAEASDFVQLAVMEAPAAPKAQKDNLNSVMVAVLEAPAAPQSQEENMDTIPGGPPGDLEVPKPEEEKLQVESSGSGELELISESEVGLEAEEVNGDFENMTVRQWFDRMEIILPQMVNDIADEIITDMMDKSWRFDNYVAECSNNMAA